MTAYQVTGADCIVSLGGGSTIGLGKAIALRNGADQVVIPTTCARSEMTVIPGQTENGAKTNQRGAAIWPGVVVYDVDLTVTLPPAMTVTSALNAIARGAEALNATDGNPVLEVMSLDAMRAFRAGLPRVLLNPQDRAARAQVLYGAWACSAALGYVFMAPHHKPCHVLGGCCRPPGKGYAWRSCACRGPELGGQPPKPPGIFGAKGSWKCGFAFQCGVVLGLRQSTSGGRLPCLIL